MITDGCRTLLCPTKTGRAAERCFDLSQDVTSCKLACVQMLSSRLLFVVLYTLSGAAALVYEVTWTRLLTLQMGHTVSAVSTVLAAFMGGLAIGAWIAGRFNISGAQRLRTYAILEIVDRKSVV